MGDSGVRSEESVLLEMQAVNAVLTKLQMNTQTACCLVLVLKSACGVPAPSSPFPESSKKSHLKVTD